MAVAGRRAARGMAPIAVRPCAGGADVEPLADEFRRAAALVDPLDPTQDRLHIRLANRQGSYARHFGPNRLELCSPHSAQLSLQ